MTDGPRSVFFYDLGSPYSYLAAERIDALFVEACGEPPEWQPILLGGLFKRYGRDSWANGPERNWGIGEVERRASAYGLPGIAWPRPFPANTLVAMRAATYAKEIGRAVSFSLAAFRQAFAAGRDLSEPDNVAVAGAATELHPRALIAAVQRPAVKTGLREATEHAGDLGVRGVPSVLVRGEVFWGDDRLDEAAGSAAALS
jgi:2-hydroxychromene-2-carboxylate isomerase